MTPDGALVARHNGAGGPSATTVLVSIGSEFTRNLHIMNLSSEFLNVVFQSVCVESYKGICSVPDV